MKKEIRVYVLNIECYDGEFCDLSDEEVMDIAEQFGDVYSLKGFERAFNDDEDEVNPNYYCIRFIEVEVYDEQK